jgi:molecular chaperone DnaJ
MKLSEAYEELGLPSTANLEDVKKQYKLLAKKWHPDVNKAPEAEAKFKKINEAYQCVSSGKGTDREDLHWQNQNNNPFSGFNPFGNRQSQPQYQIENIDCNITISFKNSVIGCKEILNFKRKTKCKDCNGQGNIAINNGCDKCGGRGQVTHQQGNMIFTQTCNKCRGRTQINPCSSCYQKGIVDADTSITVSIPGGILDSNILRLNGMGHYVGNFGPIEQHTDVHLHVKVIPEPGLTLDGSNVISNITISLIEALQGCKKNINTIMGSKEIEIKPKSRNKDEVILPKFGVNRAGDQKIILDVQYPDNIELLINSLVNSTERNV